MLNIVFTLSKRHIQHIHWMLWLMNLDKYLPAGNVNSSRLQAFFRIALHRHFVEFIRKTCWRVCATLLKNGAVTCVFLWIFQNFLEHHFYRTSPSDCFWELWSDQSFGYWRNLDNTVGYRYWLYHHFLSKRSINLPQKLGISNRNIFPGLLK